MDSIAPILAFTFGLVAGTFLFATVSRWIFAIATTVQNYRSGDRQKPIVWSLLTAVLLHSGPWTLAIAAFLAYYLLSRPHAAWWFWFFVGALFSPALVIAAWLRAVRRSKSGDKPVPLTPERLAIQRSRFIWSTTLFFGGAMSAILIGGMSGVVRMPGLVVVIIAISMAGGYVFALIMWQWKKSLLESEDYERRRAESGK